MRRVASPLVPTLLVLAAGCSLAGAASAKVTTSGISAHLTSTSFKSTQARSVKLVYTFTAPSRTFSYRLSRKWRVPGGGFSHTVMVVEKRGHFEGTYTMTVKKIFAGKQVRGGVYRLRLYAGGWSTLLGFKVINKPVLVSSPTIAGIATQGQTLTAGTGSWRNSPASYSYRWGRCRLISSLTRCSDIPGAGSRTYTLGFDDVDASVYVDVTATNAYGSTTAASEKTSVVAGLPPVNLTPPIIFGGPTIEGQSLGVLLGGWSSQESDPGGAYTRVAVQWLRCDPTGNNCIDVPPVGWGYGGVTCSQLPTSARPSASWSPSATPGARQVRLQNTPASSADCLGSY
jgi:hypothetical protein